MSQVVVWDSDTGRTLKRPGPQLTGVWQIESLGMGEQVILMDGSDRNRSSLAIRAERVFAGSSSVDMAAVRRPLNYLNDQ
jgi:hypothetical protein